MADEAGARADRGAVTWLLRRAAKSALIRPLSAGWCRFEAQIGPGAVIWKSP